MREVQAKGQMGTTSAERNRDAGMTSVPASLLDAVIDVDDAIDEGGLELQEALARMHDELVPVIQRAGGSPNRDIDERPDA